MSPFNYPAYTMEEIRILHESGIPKEKLILNILYDRAFWEQRKISYYEADKHIEVAETFVNFALQAFKN